MRTGCCILLVFFTFSIGWTQPISKLGGLPGSPLRMGFSAYGIGFGNALASVRSDRIVGYYNPALTPFQSKPMALVSVGFLTLDRYLNHVSYTVQLPPAGGLSLSVVNSGTSNIDGRDKDGQHTSSYTTSENAFLFSFGLRVHSFVSVGISAKILYHKLFDEVSSTTAGFDVGGIVLVSDEWTVGACIQDIGSKYKWDTSRLYGLNGNSTIERFPVRKKLGISFRPAGSELLASIEVEHISTILFLRGGAEYALVEQFKLHAGIDQIGFSSALLPKPAFGFTTKSTVGPWIGHLTYSYVFEPYGPSGIHLLALALEFQ